MEYSSIDVTYPRPQNALQLSRLLAVHVLWGHGAGCGGKNKKHRMCSGDGVSHRNSQIREIVTINGENLVSDSKFEGTHARARTHLCGICRQQHEKWNLCCSHSLQILGADRQPEQCVQRCQTRLRSLYQRRCGTQGAVGTMNSWNVIGKQFPRPLHFTAAY